MDVDELGGQGKNKQLAKERGENHFRVQEASRHFKHSFANSNLLSGTFGASRLQRSPLLHVPSSTTFSGYETQQATRGTRVGQDIVEADAQIERYTGMMTNGADNELRESHQVVLSLVGTTNIGTMKPGQRNRVRDPQS